MKLAAIEHADTLRAIACSSPTLMRALEAARSIGLPSWCIGAGAIRNTVWSHLHGKGPFAINKVDLIFFDPDTQPDQQQRIEIELSRTFPGFAWDVTNQAYVHDGVHRQVASRLRRFARSMKGSRRGRNMPPASA